MELRDVRLVTILRVLLGAREEKRLWFGNCSLFVLSITGLVSISVSFIKSVVKKTTAYFSQIPFHHPRYTTRLREVLLLSSKLLIHIRQNAAHVIINHDHPPLHRP